MVFLYLNSDRMGVGDETLGRKLLAAFLRELVNADVKIDAVGCVNSGIHLTTEGSDVLDSLKALEEKGARIASCGTCLDFFDKRRSLAIGEVGTMDQTVQIMSIADRVIRPC